MLKPTAPALAYHFNHRYTRLKPLFCAESHRSTALTPHWCPVHGAEVCLSNHSPHLVDLLGRRFMMSDGCLFWQLSQAHRAFPHSIPPSTFTLPDFCSALSYSLIFSSLPPPLADPVSLFPLSFSFSLWLA